MLNTHLRIWTSGIFNLSHIFFNILKNGFKFRISLIYLNYHKIYKFKLINYDFFLSFILDILFSIGLLPLVHCHRLQVHGRSELSQDLAGKESKTDLIFCSRVYHDESSLGLSGIKWVRLVIILHTFLPFLSLFLFSQVANASNVDVHGCFWKNYKNKEFITIINIYIMSILVKFCIEMLSSRWSRIYIEMWICRWKFNTC